MDGSGSRSVSCERPRARPGRSRRCPVDRKCKPWTRIARIARITRIASRHQCGKDTMDHVTMLRRFAGMLLCSAAVGGCADFEPAGAIGPAPSFKAAGKGGDAR